MQTNKKDDEYLGEGIETPHDHDILSGRGNFVNYHPGNEHFRYVVLSMFAADLTHDYSALVRKHKVAYVACPKPQKGKFSKLIYDEIQSRNPPGRFLKQHPTTKLWHVIGEKKALDKTRQALREGAPDIQKEIGVENSPTKDQREYNNMLNHGQVFHHMLDIHSSSPMIQHSLMRSPVNHAFQHTSPTRYDQFASPISPLPQHSRGFVPTMNDGRDIIVPALYAPPFHNQVHNMHQSMHQSMQQHYGQQHYGQQQHVAMAAVTSAPGSHTVRPINTHMNMPIPNINTSSSMERPTWSDVGPISVTEENERHAPLPSVNNHSVFSSRHAKDKDVSDHQASITSLEVALASDQRYPKFKSNGNSSQRSLMSLSVDGMGVSQRDFGDASYLSALFNSSLKITSNKPPTSRTNNMAGSSYLAGTMEMSVNTLNEEDHLSDFGDSAVMKMTESQAEMSFGNVFDDNA